jgi:1-deoxy-D-xylulose-5-phosphate reductoisomerase
MKRKIDVFGSTGSIGTQTLEIVKNNPDLFEVKMLTCGSNVDLLNKQIKEFNPKLVGIADNNQKGKLKEKENITYAYGEKEIFELMNRSASEIVVMGISGASGLIPTITAIRNKKNIALATKEVMVMA